jgi:hypothetical protein
MLTPALRERRSAVNGLDGEPRTEPCLLFTSLHLLTPADLGLTNQFPIRQSMAAVSSFPTDASTTSPRFVLDTRRRLRHQRRKRIRAPSLHVSNANHWIVGGGNALGFNRSLLRRMVSRYAGLYLASNFNPIFRNRESSASAASTRAVFVTDCT